MRRFGLALVVVVALAGCAADDDVPTAILAAAAAEAVSPPTSTSSTSVAPPRPTTTPTTTTTLAPPRVVFLTEGASGAGVWELEARLAELGYWPGPVDAETKHAVTALQKVAGIERSGRVDLATERALRGALVPTVRNPVGHVIEITRDIDGSAAAASACT
jgi:peptidoglycan hydrolase-like protein with peptidoglycan-binding domain